MNKLKWYSFYDMNSGGRQKTPYYKIFIQAANKYESWDIFEEKFSISPTGATCECCGEDFWIDEHEGDDPLDEEGVLIIPYGTEKPCK